MRQKQQHENITIKLRSGYVRTNSSDSYYSSKNQHKTQGTYVPMIMIAVICDNKNSLRNFYVPKTMITANIATYIVRSSS